jgi:hypothetical protein
MPLAPPGTRVLVNVTPNQRANMAPHGINGWHVGPSKEHYRCHKCHIPSTYGVCDALTVDWFPYKTTCAKRPPTCSRSFTTRSPTRSHRSPAALASPTPTSKSPKCSSAPPSAPSQHQSQCRPVFPLSNSLCQCRGCSPQHRRSTSPQHQNRGCSCQHRPLPCPLCQCSGC